MHADAKEAPIAEDSWRGRDWARGWLRADGVNLKREGWSKRGEVTASEELSIDGSTSSH